MSREIPVVRSQSGRCQGPMVTPSCHGVASTVHARCPAHGVACPVSLTPLQRCAAKFFAHSLHFWDGHNFSYDFISWIVSETHSVSAFGSVRLSDTGTLALAALCHGTHRCAVGVFEWLWLFEWFDCCVGG